MDFNNLSTKALEVILPIIIIAILIKLIIEYFKRNF